MKIKLTEAMRADVDRQPHLQPDDAWARWGKIAAGITLDHQRGQHALRLEREARDGAPERRGV